MAESKVSLKLLINTRTYTVVFAEAGKDCVDFLFHILTLPIATVIRLLKQEGMAGPLRNLYESVENLNVTYIQPDQNKDVLLKPVGPTSGSAPMFLLEGPGERTGKVAYKCSHCSNYSEGQNAHCYRCNTKMTYKLKYVNPVVTGTEASDEGGFVKAAVTYMVMDDLVVKPMSTISSLNLMSKFSVQDINALKEMEVHIGMNEVCFTKQNLISFYMCQCFLSSVLKRPSLLFDCRL